MNDALLKLCKDSVLKEYKPFAFNGYTYATNGYILVRIKGELSGIQKVADEPIPVSSLDWSLFEHYDKGLKIQKAQVKAVNKPVYECPECKCEGYINYHSGYHYYEWECLTCYGDGTVKTTLLWKLADNIYLLLYTLELLLDTVGDIECFPSEIGRLVPFRFSNGDGFVSPYNNEHPKNIREIPGQLNLFDNGSVIEALDTELFGGFKEFVRKKE